MISKKLIIFLLFAATTSCQTKDHQAANETTTEVQSDSSLSRLLNVAQETEEPTKKRKNSSCDWDVSRCSLPKEHEVHFNPYYNGHLCENFNPEQIDYSKEYLELQTSRSEKYGVDVTNELPGYNFILDSLFNYGDTQKNGVIGSNYTRIRVHIENTRQLSDKKFKIFGQTNVKGNVCNFSGTLELYKIYEYKENFDYPGQATLFAHYQLNEDSIQNHVGIFEGTFECAILINHDKRTIKLDEGMSIADGYYNRTFVGTWTPYNSSKSKKCIWGDNRLPFTFDFDQGDGEMYVNEKYTQNGWEPFINRTEYTIIDGKRQLKEVWWK